MSCHRLFLAASQMAEESLEMLQAAEMLAAEGKQEKARACLKGITVLASSELSTVLRDMKEDIVGVAEGNICRHGPGGVSYYDSGHEVILFIWEILQLVEDCHPDAPVRADLLEWLGVNTSALRVHVRRERKKLLEKEARRRKTSSPPARRNRAMYAWVDRQRSKKTPLTWEEIYDDLARGLIARRGWDLPRTVRALEQGYGRYLKLQRQSSK